MLLPPRSPGSKAGYVPPRRDRDDRISLRFQPVDRLERLEARPRRPAALDRAEDARDWLPGPIGKKVGGADLRVEGGLNARESSAARCSWTMPSARQRPPWPAARSSASVPATSTPPLLRKPLSMPVSSRSAADHSPNSSTLHDRSRTAGCSDPEGDCKAEESARAGRRRLAAQSRGDREPCTQLRRAPGHRRSTDRSLLLPESRHQYSLT